MHLAHERNSRLTKRRARTLGSLLAGLALLGSCAAFTLSRSTDAPYATLLSGCTDSRVQPYLSCVSAAVLQYGYQHPRTAGALLGYVFEHAPDRGRRTDLRPLSETAHYAGMELSALPITLHQAFADCGYAFKAACMHGFVMEKLDRMQVPQTQLVPSFLDYCRPVESDGGYYQNCLHAVGHELWARTGLSLNDTLALCDGLRRAADLSACWSGILMEYSKGDPAHGHHSHAPAGKRTLPCGSLAPRFREVCTYAEASYRQYVPGWEPPRTTYERCASAPQAYRLRCMMLVSERLLIAQSGNAQLARSTCAQLNSGAAICYRSIVQLQDRTS